MTKTQTWKKYRDERRDSAKSDDFVDGYEVKRFIDETGVWSRVFCAELQGTKMGEMGIYRNGIDEVSVFTFDLYKGHGDSYELVRKEDFDKLKQIILNENDIAPALDGRRYTIYLGGDRFDNLKLTQLAQLALDYKFGKDGWYIDFDSVEPYVDLRTADGEIIDHITTIKMAHDTDNDTIRGLAYAVKCHIRYPNSGNVFEGVFIPQEDEDRILYR